MKVIRISKSGWIFILIVIFLGVAGINTGNNMVYLITSFLLGIMGVSGFFGKLNISNVDIDIKFLEDIFAGKESVAKITIKNRKRFPSFLINLRSDYFNELFLFVKKNQNVTKFIKILFPKRGYNKIGTITIASNFPFGFFERFRYINYEKKFLAYPIPIDLKIERFLIDEGEKEVLNFKKGEGEELLNIRDYIYGDDKRKIHWKLSIKHNNLMIKEFQNREDNIIFIDFDKINISDFERKISAITYFVLKNRNVILKVNDEIIKGTRNILRKLALL